MATLDSATYVPMIVDGILNGKTLDAAGRAAGLPHPKRACAWINSGLDGGAINAARRLVWEREEQELCINAATVLQAIPSSGSVRAALVSVGLNVYFAHNLMQSKEHPEVAARFRAAVKEITAKIQKPPPAPRPIRPKHEKRGTVYFIQGVNGGCIKIGFTAGPVEVRMAYLQVGSPTPLRLLHAVAAPRVAEKWAHARFAGSHSHGEWFHATADILAFIKSGAMLLLIRPDTPANEAHA